MISAIDLENECSAVADVIRMVTNSWEEHTGWPNKK